ncbi:hypothetical protein RYX36_030721 [Vicia faba]
MVLFMLRCLNVLSTFDSTLPFTASSPRFSSSKCHEFTASLSNLDHASLCIHHRHSSPLSLLPFDSHLSAMDQHLSRVSSIQTGSIKKNSQIQRSRTRNQSYISKNTKPAVSGVC